MRKIKNKNTGEVQTQYRKWNGESYVFLPINDQWEILPAIVE